MSRRTFGCLVTVVATAVLSSSCAGTLPGSDPVKLPSLSAPSRPSLPFESPSRPQETRSQATPTPNRPTRTPGSWDPTPRPRAGELDLSKLRDCAKLKQVPVARWQVKKGSPVTEYLDRTKTLVCTWAHKQPPYSLTMIKYERSVYGQGIWSDAEPQETEVHSFPAWTASRMTGRPTCEIVLDTHDKQHLVIDYNVTGPIKNNTVNCKHLPDIASEMITALAG